MFESVLSLLRQYVICAVISSLCILSVVTQIEWLFKSKHFSDKYVKCI